jgi:hypothetical protein
MVRLANCRGEDFANRKGAKFAKNAKKEMKEKKKERRRDGRKVLAVLLVVGAAHSVTFAPLRFASLFFERIRDAAVTGRRAVPALQNLLVGRKLRPLALQRGLRPPQEEYGHR